MSPFSINGVKYDESQRCKKCGRIPGYPYPPWEQAPANCECRTRGKAPEMTETTKDEKPKSTGDPTVPGSGAAANPLTCPEHQQPWGTVYRDGSIDFDCGCHAKAPVAPKPEGRPAGAVPLCEARTGIFRTLDGAYGFKTEYTRSSSVSRSETGLGAIEAYCLESGEAWWGDPPQTAESQRAQLVVPVDLLEQIRLLSRALAEAADGLSRAGRPRLARRAREVLGHVERGTPMKSRKPQRKRRKS